ncbi:MAG: hypothetical protein Q4F82_08020 [bacterium]|nr:hypothetical protein [bacterium]
MVENLVRKEKQKTEKGNGFPKVFLIIGLVAFATVMLLWIVLGKGTKDNVMPSSREIHHFVGSVGANIHMSIIIEGTIVTGRYYYDSQRNNGNSSSLILRGEKTGNRIKLTETYDGKTTGWFEGDLASGVYCGTFTRAKDGKMFDFNLVETGSGAGFFSEGEIAF